jgi:site-specific DNA recombinase
MTIFYSAEIKTWEFEMNEKAMGYVRVSTDEQAREGVSLEAQAERIKALAKAKGWKFEGIVDEPGYSGKDLNRPGIKQLIEKCRKREIDIIVVFKVDRLTRKQKDLWQILEDVFIPNEVGFISVTEPFDTTTASGRAFLGMLGIFAQLERDLVSERTVEALSHKKKKGEWYGRLPKGFRLDSKGRLEGDPETLEKIQKAKRLKRQGKSFQAISEALNMPKTTVFRLVNTNLKSLKSQYLNIQAN